MKNNQRKQPVMLQSSFLFMIFMAIILAVVAGYLGTKTIIYPYFLNEKSATDEQTPGVQDEVQSNENNNNSDGIVDQTNEKKDVISDERDIQEVSAAAGSTEIYSLQFGNFSTKESADELIEKLKTSNLAAYILKDGESYKVIGIPFLDKERAAQSATILAKYYEGTFVTTSTLEFETEEQKNEFLALMEDYKKTDELSIEEKKQVLLNKQEDIIMNIKEIMQ